MIGNVTTQSPGSTLRGGASASAKTVVAPPPKKTNAEGLTTDEAKTVADLKKRDTEVRAHEQAHKTVGGPYAGTPSFETVTGPDGRQYAVGGEVKIDSSPVANNPAATIRKMEIVIRAALAPTEPSSQDTQVAGQAQQVKLEAQVALNQQIAEEREKTRGADSFQKLSNLLEQAQSTVQEETGSTLNIQI